MAASTPCCTAVKAVTPASTFSCRPARHSAVLCGSPLPRSAAHRVIAGLPAVRTVKVSASQDLEAPLAHDSWASTVQSFEADEVYKRDAHCASLKQYQEMYKLSVEDPEGFWGAMAKEFYWETPFEEKHLDYNFDMNKGPVNINWFKGGRTNICFNALDRHIEAGKGSDPCFFWEGNEPGEDAVWTFDLVYKEVCRLANWLKSVGVSKGDAVAIYMPMLAELPIAMLACARIGAVHSVVFGGFSAESLGSRVADCNAKVVITCSAVMRGKKRIALKSIVDNAMDICSSSGHEVENVLCYDNSRAQPREDTSWKDGRDLWWQDVIPTQSTDCGVEWVAAEDPLFLLYTSGSTGKPKGVLHTTGGYMVYAATTSKYVFDLHPQTDVYFCTADCGWITGHTYLAYGPMLNGVTQVVFEGVPSYPDPSRMWDIIDKYNVSQFYTAPTAIRALMREGDQWAAPYILSSLRVLGTVGEPINPEAWRWYHEVIGKGRVPIVDTWWQTETGGHMITPLPAAWKEKPGSATLPFFGSVPCLLDDQGNEIEGEGEGLLCIKKPWPSTIRGVFGDQKRYEDTYFSMFKGYYFSGDAARRDKDGYYWITGRVDDVINVSGHRIGTAEVESSLVRHKACSEAAVVGYEHPIKGQGIYAYVTLMQGVEVSEDLRKSLVMAVREQIGAFAAPDVIHWAPALPKTRSGKIMRRILRKIANKEEDQLGDISTLADPSVVAKLIELRGQ
mmetsp:Transcript_20643/g.57298  ORF Transcript_20643/g.57298 Transcript_20643/m.57298 type:complete len:731 (+) Transcript_20643:217-2409(+)